MYVIKDKKIFFSWLWVVICTIVIYLTIPVARRIRLYITENFGRKIFLHFVYVTLILVLLYFLYYLILKLKIKNASNYLWLFLIGGLYIYFTSRLQSNPEEAFHFLEYGLLSFLLFRALSHKIKDRSIYFIATLLALFIGTFDEIIQWIIPQRYWNFNDVGLNFLAAGLFQIGIRKVIQPKEITKKNKF